MPPAQIVLAGWQETGDCVNSRMPTLDGEQRTEKCSALQQALNQGLRPFAVPLLISPDLELRPSEVRNATGALLHVGNKQCLVTCYHVWEELQPKKRGHNSSVMVALLNDGYGAFHIERPTLLTNSEKLGLAKEVDLAVFDITGVQHLGEKKCFPFGDATTHEPVQGDIVVTMGFPGMWRKSDKNYTCVSSGPLPFTVGDVTTRSFIIPDNNPQNHEVFAYLDAQPRSP